ncbi:hypothetical protein [Cytobacillus firmus]|uniref:hypothetical protein n=1 Tax=Cytobacillus firmus TaxID=1399 RepID=UPI001C8E3998|nr:hypothetical protein [Cytobacillus firmus]MBX9973406.1 hypothetical protein [Cytobacillus firmus]
MAHDAFRRLTIARKERIINDYPDWYVEPGDDEKIKELSRVLNDMIMIKYLTDKA